jgi:hypothetical protein
VSVIAVILLPHAGRVPRDADEDDDALPEELRHIGIVECATVEKQKAGRQPDLSSSSRRPVPVHPRSHDRKRISGRLKIVGGMSARLRVPCRATSSMERIWGAASASSRFFRTLSPMKSSRTPALSPVPSGNIAAVSAVFVRIVPGG